MWCSWLRARRGMVNIFLADLTVAVIHHHIRRFKNFWWILWVLKNSWHLNNVSEEFLITVLKVSPESS
jgi:hypothetical protein